MKGICFTISTHHPKKKLFFRSNETILKVVSYCGFNHPTMSPNVLKGQVIRMADLLSRFARQLK